MAARWDDAWSTDHPGFKRPMMVSHQIVPASSRSAERDTTGTAHTGSGDVERPADFNAREALGADTNDLDLVSIDRHRRADGRPAPELTHPEAVTHDRARDAAPLVVEWRKQPSRGRANAQDVEKAPADPEAANGPRDAARGDVEAGALPRHQGRERLLPALEFLPERIGERRVTRFDASAHASQVCDSEEG